LLSMLSHTLQWQVVVQVATTKVVAVVVAEY
jgi:hypothetical protein